MILIFDHTHDLDLRISRSNFETDISQEWQGWLTWNENVGESIIHDHDSDLFGWNMVGWVDVPEDSDRIVTGVTSDVGVPSTRLVQENVFENVARKAATIDV